MSNKRGSFIVNIEGTELSAEDKEILKHPLIGGVIFFERNYVSREQLKGLTQAIRSLRNDPFLLMVDQEGGRVQRFIPEFTRLPYMGEFGKMYSTNPAQAKLSAKNGGALMANELLTVGIDLSLAPVLDLNKGISTIIGERAFHPDPNIVIELASAFMEGMHAAGMPSTGKHFPGHGSVALDSHLATPIDERSLAEIENKDLLPFTGMIKAGMTAMMASHLIFPQVDELPVGFSRTWLQDILRQRLGFKGPILSDDLNMEGANISANYADRVVLAKEAGCDFMLLCNNREGVIQVIDTVPVDSLCVSDEKWLVLQGDFKRAIA